MCGMFYSSCVKHRPFNEELTKEQLKDLIQRTKWNLVEIEEFYHYFIHCYPNGSLSENDFLIYFQKVRPKKLMTNDSIEMIRKLFFPLFDINHQNRIHFNEFLLFNEFLYLKSFHEKIQSLSQQKLPKSIENLQYPLTNIENILENFFDLIDENQLNLKSKSQICVEKIRSNSIFQSKKSMKFKEILTLINDSSSVFDDEFNSKSSSSSSLIQRVELF